jgi:hypothetical protein
VSGPSLPGLLTAWVTWALRVEYEEGDRTLAEGVEGVPGVTCVHYQGGGDGNVVQVIT